MEREREREQKRERERERSAAAAVEVVTDDPAWPNPTEFIMNCALGQTIKRCEGGEEGVGYNGCQQLVVVYLPSLRVSVWPTTLAKVSTCILLILQHMELKSGIQNKIFIMKPS